MGNNKIKNMRADRILMWTVFVVFVLYAISLLYPFFWLLLNSFKTKKDFLLNVNGLPTVWTFENWINSFTLTVDKVSIPMMYFNSIFVTVGSTFLSMMSCSATAYILTKYNFKGKDGIYAFAVIMMMIPTMGSMASTYKMYTTIGLVNTYAGIFVFSLGGFGSYFLIMYAFYKNLSWTYAEAAQIDGAGHWRIYLTIMLPMAAPALFSVGILQAIGYWNDYFTIYMYAPEKATIAYGIQRIAEQNKQNLPQIFAAMLFSTFPVLIVFACFQKTIMANTTVGGIKG